MPENGLESAKLMLFFFGIGDHGAIIVNIPIKNILGTKVCKIFSLLRRQLKCNHLVTFKKYNDYLKGYAKNCIVLKKPQALEASKHILSKDKYMQKMETLYCIRRNEIRAAEQKCQK